MIYCSDLSSKGPQISLKTVPGFTKLVGDQWIRKRKRTIGHTRTHYLQRDSLPYRLESTSKWCHGKASKEKMVLLLVLGKQEMVGAKRAQKSEADSITNLETCPCFVFEDSASQIWGREGGGRRERENVWACQCWPDASDILVSVRDRVINYQSLLSGAY